MESPSQASQAATERLDQDDKGGRKRQVRTGRACDNCRKRKVRCTGEPRCRNCIEQDATCVYGLGRRDRLNEATEQKTKLIALLRDLSLHVDVSGKQMIDDHLENLEHDNGTPASGINPKSETPDLSVISGKRSREASPSYEGKRERGLKEAEVSESVGNDSLDLLDEDLLRSQESRATGFVGTNSSMQWMRSLKSQIGSPDSSREVSMEVHNQPSDSNEPIFRQVLQISDSTFYLDRNDIQLDDVIVDPYELPKPDVTERLFNSYLKTVHASFPILPPSFEDQFRKYIESAKRSRPYQLPEEWQAMLNLVMAIGAQYSHLAQTGWQNGAKDHLIYMTRATRILRLDKLATSLPSPSLSFIQSTGLLALYYLVIGQVSRAWMMIGISLRFALAAGLHLRNENPKAAPVQTESLVRTWWSLHSIETLLCAIIGRPCIIPNDQCTVPLPQVTSHWGDGPLSQSSNSTNSSRGEPDTVTRSSFLGARVVIALIMQKTLFKLYSPRISTDSWDSIQRDITSLTSELDSWAGSAHLAGLSAKTALEEGVDRHNLLLAFHYQSTKLLISRPCLCRLERRKGQSHASFEFNSKTAEACVAAAQAIAWLLPDEPDRIFFYEQTPWWSTVHIIMQALAVILLKMSFGPSHLTHRGEELAGTVRKLVRWLRRLSTTNDVAERAYSMAVDIIKIAAPKIQVDITTPIKEEPVSESDVQSEASPFFPTPSSTSTVFSETPSQSHSFAKPEWNKLYPPRHTNHTPNSQTTARSSMSFSPPSANTQFSSPPQLPASQFSTSGMDSTRMVNLNAFRAQQQAQGFGNYPFDQSLGNIDTPSVFGNPFMTNFDLPGTLFNEFYGDGQHMNFEGAFDMYMEPNQDP
ncbi:hypothetical protein P280DRAFT_80590 [Massarina eburnea CBS 473.64]|uniref:Zn(2)-C6 fungal-type domain-containing protein n=1 Tax=Massarina eburnea CBS 473.64 TaxID=1395130 RepID=A0A6A6RSW7_9PLEO|nr:hypothetical protein P280DRAFT_80590 [Massarina eburnea CBS 473.64]